MDLKVLSTFALFFVLLPCTMSTRTDDDTWITSKRNHGMEHRYYGLLEDLQSIIDDHQDSDKTSNAGQMPLRDKCYCNPAEKPMRHCADILAAGQKKSGIYKIQPEGLPPVTVYCDMTTRGGGWTIFQRRLDGSVDFYRGWDEYVRGFGDVYGEYWLGLHNIHILTHNTPMELYIHLEDFDNATRFAHYDFMAISSELNKFNLDLGNYFGNAGDSLSYHRGGNFGTKDQDNDSHAGKCGEITGGAWWYKSCYNSNLNGRYLKGQVDTYPLAWTKWRGVKYSLKTSVMMIRPKY